MKKSPIYLFYEIVANRANRTSGDDGDVHYCCFHGAHKICTIKKSMRSNLNGVFSFFATLFFSQNIFSSVNNLCVHIKPMYQLYSVLKDRDEPPTPDEIDIASGK